MKTKQMYTFKELILGPYLSGRKSIKKEDENLPRKEQRKVCPTLEKITIDIFRETVSRQSF